MNAGRMLVLVAVTCSGACMIMFARSALQPPNHAAAVSVRGALIAQLAKLFF